MSETAYAIAADIRSGQRRAVDVVGAALARIAERDTAINAFTAVVGEQALADAARVDAKIARGEEVGPLAGVPFAVKNLFDVAGLTTLAGSKILQDASPAVSDAFGVAALRRAGAVLVGALNMDEFACGITTENAHYGATRNPLALEHVAGGSSGGSAAAVAAGMVPLTLGTDTGGSIRVPAAMCGIWGLKPTFGRLSRSGVVPFSWSMDHIGPLAADLRDLALGYDVLQGRDVHDHAQADRAAAPVSHLLSGTASGLRVAMLGGWFFENASEDAIGVVTEAAKRIGVTRTVVLDRTDAARAAMNLIVMSEAGASQLPALRRRARDFDPMTRGRMLAGAMLPAAHISAAQRFRSWYRRQAEALFREVDVLIAPALPFPAIRIGQDSILLNGREVASRPCYPALTAPLSFIGLPVISMPVPRPGGLPLGIQIVARPFAEGDAFRVAAALKEI